MENRIYCGLFFCVLSDSVKRLMNLYHWVAGILESGGDPVIWCEWCCEREKAKIEKLPGISERL